MAILHGEECNAVGVKATQSPGDTVLALEGALATLEKTKRRPGAMLVGRDWLGFSKHKECEEEREAASDVGMEGKSPSVSEVCPLPADTMGGKFHQGAKTR